MRLNKHTVLLLIMMFFASPALAEDVIYSPDNCEFQVTLPSEPHKAQRCKPDAPEDCHAVTSFTHVFGLDATVDVRLTCNKAEDQMYERYSGDIMRATLEAMAGKNKLGEYESHYQEHDNAKQAVLIGSGASGNNNKIYMMQLWIGKTSVFTIEGELIGGPHEEADDMFADILKSARQKENTEAAESEEGDDEEDKDSAEDEEEPEDE